MAFEMKRPKMQKVNDLTASDIDFEYNEIYSTSDTSIAWNDIKSELNKAGYFAGRLSAKRTDYGFVDGVFVHITKLSVNVDSMLDINNLILFGEANAKPNKDGKRSAKNAKFGSMYSNDKTIEKIIKEAKASTAERLNTANESKLYRSFRKDLDNYKICKECYRRIGSYPINKTVIVKKADKADGYIKKEFEFSKEITRDQFIEFCTIYNLDINCEIVGEGTKWIHTTIKNI